MLSISVAALIWLVSPRTFSTALDPTLEGTWNDWKATHGKQYVQEEEESFRRAVWEENLQMIQDHNKEADLGKYTYWLGMNHFGDLRKMMLPISMAVLIWLISLRTFSTALDPSLEGTWRDWKATHGKEYVQEEEESFRRAVWEENLQMIQDHNKEADLGKYTYWLGMNHFGDLTNEELDKRLHCLPSHLDNVIKVKGITFKSSDDPDIPDHVDWRIKGGVTKVKDQGSCGSCWSFSATGALEGMHFKKTGKLVSLSEQNLVDCSEENYGCMGGFMHLAFETVRMEGGINSEKSYPYDGQDEGGCRYEHEESITRCNSFGVIMEKDEKGLQEAVAKIGPISVGIDARSSKFSFYKSGIFKENNNGAKELNHAMLIVGYNNSSEGQSYWILKNSWSTLWGEKGYMRLAKGSNECNVAEYAVFPIPDPKKGL